LFGLEEAVIDALKHYYLGKLGSEVGVVGTADILEGLLNLAYLIFQDLAELALSDTVAVEEDYVREAVVVLLEGEEGVGNEFDYCVHDLLAGGLEGHLRVVLGEKGVHGGSEAHTAVGLLA
jgi:hypothetical protein